jgi:AmmeMemoRadiSam system protein B/AmmeMemoRadiSam system protein A
VRRSTGGGLWFPADAETLRAAVDGFLSESPPIVGGKPIALVVPHAGYQYSGAVAGKAYATLADHSYQRVIVLGLSHRAPLRGASVLRVDAYETPLGRIPVDTEARDVLLRSRHVTEMPAAHQQEHSAENQLPMLQRALGDFQLVEVLVGQMTAREQSRLADAIREIIDDETLLVVSSDFTHYGPRFQYTPFREDVPDQLRSLNDRAVTEILQVDVPGWDAFLRDTEATICGRNAIALLLSVLEPREDIDGRRIAYDTSGRITGEWSNSVTYASIVFWQTGAGLTEGEQQILLRIARNTVSSHLATGEVPAVDLEQYDLTPRLTTPGAAFVTLRNGTELRGCIGHITAVRPLFMSVAENAYWASQDPRFQSNPVTFDELQQLEIEISVLTPMRRLLDPKKVRVGRDGLLIARDQDRGVLLPNVPIEQRWDREEFLAGASVKAGLPAHAWKDPQTEIYRFSAQIFGEQDHSAAARPKGER